MAIATSKVSTSAGTELRRLVAPYADQIGGPVTALRAIQDEHGWIDSEGRDAVADVFNMSRAEIRGLIEFYADFRTSPPADHIVTICGAEACQAAGSRALTKKVADRLGVELGHAAADRSVELGSVACLGLCARAPAMRVDGRLVVEADTVIDQVLDELPS
jgi:formate dehydrogenase subunit gamma